MAESIHEQIVAALAARLQAIAPDGGANYWHKPDRVVRVQSYNQLTIDPTVFTPPTTGNAGGMVYVVRAGLERHQEQGTGSASTGGAMVAQAEMFVLMLKPTQVADPSPYGEDAGVLQLEQNRMVRDFLRALLEDVTLGLRVVNLISESLEVDRDTAAPGYAIAEASFAFEYTYYGRTP